MLGGSLRTRGMPLLQSRLYSKDEELGKRDDDFRPKRRDTMSAQINPLRWRKRRFLGIVAVLGLIYLFVHNIPASLGPADLRINPAFRPFRPGGVFKEPRTIAAPEPIPTKPTETIADTTATLSRDAYTGPAIEPTGAPPRTNSPESVVTQNRYYDGMIRYFRLAETLNKYSLTVRLSESNRNVLFAASSLKSFANLIPIACAMSTLGNNSVHFMIGSREDLSIAELKSINGLDSSECPVEFHDARPDYSEYSSDLRHEAAISGALAHMANYIGHHAIIVDDEAVEDSTFTRAVRRKAKDTFKPLIEIPAGRYDEFMYIANLDHASLSQWHTPTIEIVIHAQKDSAGSLMRLLRTLSNADYKGIRLPKLTIDLATDIPQALRNVLGGFKWPARYEPADKNVDTLTLRHNVQSQRLSTEQAALRFLESYYPANHDNHILILSPQVELSPQYLQYLHYTVLEYKYKAKKSMGTGELLGISLNVPTQDISGHTPFAAPERSLDDDEDENADLKVPFLYEAPTASALLIFGDKWQVFHDYLNHRTTANRLGKAEKSKKVVTEAEPAWMEYLLELVRARAWNVLYPAHSFATVHNELARIPEEFTKDEASIKPADLSEATDLKTEEPFLLAPDTPVLKSQPEEKLQSAQIPLHRALPFGGFLPKLDYLPYLSFEGGLSNMKDAATAKDEYVMEFRRSKGGCEDEEARRPRIIQDGSAADLFCLPGIDMEFDLKAESEIAIASSHS